MEKSRNREEGRRRVGGEKTQGEGTGTWVVGGVRVSGRRQADGDLRKYGAGCAVGADVWVCVRWSRRRARLMHRVRGRVARARVRRAASRRSMGAVRARSECQVGVKRVVRVYVTRPALASGVRDMRWARRGPESWLSCPSWRPGLLCAVCHSALPCACGMSPASCPSIDILSCRHLRISHTSLLLISSSPSKPFPPAQHSSPPTPLDLHPHFFHGPTTSNRSRPSHPTT